MNVPGLVLGRETEQAIDELFDRLDVTREWAIGFFAALFSGPELVPTSTWLDAIISHDLFANRADAQRGLDLLMQLYNNVGFKLRNSPEEICPDPDDVERVADFCEGYVRGVRLQQPWLDDEAAMVPILVFDALAGEIEDEELSGYTDKPIADLEAWRRGHRERLAEYVAGMNEYWRSAEGRTSGSRKVGRNDPCPCGSGKKYKKCCLQ